MLTAPRRGERLQGPCAVALGLLFTLLLPATPRAYAERPEPPSARYEGLIQEAVFEYRRQHFTEALALFAEAHAARPSARTLRGLGMTEFELRHYVESVSALRRALRSDERPLTGKLREQTERLLRRAERFVGTVRFESDLRIEQVLVDGLLVPFDASGPLMLAVGDHTLELVAPGFAAQRKVVRVRGGEDDVLSVRFVAPREASEPAPSRAASPRHRDERRAQRDLGAPPPSRRPLRRSPWLWSAVSVAAAAGATALALGLRERGSQEAIADWPNTTLRGP